MKSDKILRAIEIAYRTGLRDGNATNDIKPYLITSQVTAHEIANKFCKAHVSGNEAHPKENKKVGEVALLDFFSWLNKGGMIKNLYLMPQELINKYIKSSNDR